MVVKEGFMGWLDDLSKILPVGEIYKDLLQPSVKQIGEGLESVVKTSRFIIAPFECLGNMHDKYLNFLKRVSDKVSDEELVEVHPKITGTILENIKYLDDENILFSMFVELLSNAVTKKNTSKAHPAFVHIINQLSPDEAVIIYYFRQREYEFWQQADFDNLNHRFYNHRIIRNDFPVNILSFPENYTMYINHLNNLQIAGVPEYKNQEPVILNNRQVGVKIFRKTSFLDFGLLFSNCCVPEIINIKNNNK
jgi:hypothetical protein